MRFVSKSMAVRLPVLMRMHVRWLIGRFGLLNDDIELLRGDA